MKRVYNLYLDESETHDIINNNSSNWTNRVFCIGGIIVEDTYDKTTFQDELNNIKLKLWGSQYPNYKDIILHEKDIRFANNSYNKNSLNKIDAYYRIFKDNKNIYLLYSELDKLVRNKNITTIASCIKHDDLDKTYNQDIQNDRTLIALQIILENFCHFLSKNHGVGRIFYEHNGDNDCAKMRMRFNLIKAMGTLFIKPQKLQELLINIEFPSKVENLPGLQVADFIPNIVSRKVSGKKLEGYNIFNNIKKFSYDGGLNNKDKFGVKVIKN